MDANDPTFQSQRSSLALANGLSRRNIRSTSWLHPYHGVVRAAKLELDPTDLRLSDAIALMSEGHVLGGWASLRAQGNHWFSGRGRHDCDREVLVHCLGGAQLRVRRGLIPCRGLLLADEFMRLENYDVSTVARAVYDEMRLARDLREAVVAFDMATSTTSNVAHTTPAAIARVIDTHHKTRGLMQARRAVVLGSTRSASPWETRTRLLAQLDADIEQLRVNLPVFDLSENLLGVADLIDEFTGLVIEFDGATHRELPRHTDDNRREEKFERAGLVVSRVTALDHRDRWGTATRMRAAQRDARSSSKRLWTLEKPAWWWTWPPARQWE